MCFYLPLESYLAEWLRYETGSGEVVSLLRGSQEADIVKYFVQVRPEDVEPDLATQSVPANMILVPIIIPETKQKPPSSYNYMPPEAKEALKDCLHTRFKIQLFYDLHKLGCIGKRQDNLIYAWMAQHGISVQHWDTIAKIYQRRRKSYLSQKNKQKIAKN